MSLNDSKIRNLKPSAKPFKVSDSHGLYLLVNPSGSRLWYLKYRINRKESRLGLVRCLSRSVFGRCSSATFRDCMKSSH